jgi:hypothetical protein
MRWFFANGFSDQNNDSVPRRSNELAGCAVEKDGIRRERLHQISENVGDGFGVRRPKHGLVRALQIKALPKCYGCERRKNCCAPETGLVSFLDEAATIKDLSPENCQ